MSVEIPHIDLLMKMLSIPATSRNEQERSDFLEDYMKGIGFGVTRIHNNLLVGNAAAKDERLKVLLNTHMDTVPPVEGWENDPYIPQLEGDKVIGLGSNDAGASVVSLIAAYQRMQSILEKHLNLVLLISAEEEVSGPNGITTVLPELGDFDAAIVGEPTEMHPAVAERGLMVIDGEVKGRAGHAARNEGENAIYKALKDIESIAGLQFQNRSHWLPEPGAQVTMIEAGTGHNVIPDICRFVVDVRSNDQYSNETMLEILRSGCAADLVPRSTRLKPSGLENDHILMQAIRSCRFKPFGSSTLSDMALIPFPSVKMGPGDSARSHTAGEFIRISEMDEGVKLYCRFLETMKDIHEKKRDFTHETVG